MSSIVKDASKIIRSRAFQAYQYLYNPKLTPPRQAWVENFDPSKERTKLALAELHPNIFGTFPRPDYIAQVVRWQQIYRRINWISMPTRNELPGGTKKPWPQKGTGRARHGSTNSPIWLKGGWARGPRGPETWFYRLPFFHVVNGLRSMLTIKLAQDDLKIIDSLSEFRSRDSQVLMDLIEGRNWGPSALIVDKTDIFPEDITLAARDIRHVNLVPTYGLNPMMMAKHETLIMTVDAIHEVEEKLLHQLVRIDLNDVVQSRRIAGV